MPIDFSKFHKKAPNMKKQATLLSPEDKSDTQKMGEDGSINVQKVGDPQLLKKVPKSNMISQDPIVVLGHPTGEIDKKQEIVNWVFANLLHLYDGIYNYLRIWKTRYHKYLIKSPESPVIFKYQKMQELLDYIKELTNLKEENLK